MIRAKITIEEKSMRLLRRKMKQVIDDIGSAYGPNRQIGVRLARWVSENFETQGGKVGGWKPFKYGGRLVTKKKSRNYRNIGSRGFKGFGLARINGRLVDVGAQLLRDTNRMHGSIVPYGYHVTGTSVAIGSDVEYSKYHEYGLPMRGLPARRMLPRASDKEVQELIFKIYDDYIYQVTGK